MSRDARPDPVARIRSRMKHGGSAGSHVHGYARAGTNDRELTIRHAALVGAAMS